MDRKRMETLQLLFRRLPAVFSRRLPALALLALVMTAARPSIPAARVSSNEEILWARQFGTSTDDTANGVCIDPSGYVLVAGGTSRTLPDQVAFGNWDAYVRMYDGRGNIRWTRQFGSSAAEAASSVCVDGSGNVYVAGWTEGVLPGEASAGNVDAFVRKYNSLGDLVWTRQFGSSAYDVAYGVSTDVLGDVYVAGVTLGALPGERSAGGYDGFLRKYSQFGTELWTVQFGTPQDDFALGVCTNAAGSIFVGGFTGGVLPGQASAGNADAFVLKFDFQGSVLWTRQFGSSAGDSATGVSTDGSGNVFVAGSTGGILPGQSSAGGNDAFLRKYDGAGNDLWTRQWGSPGSDVAQAVSADFRDTVFVAGETTEALPGESAAGDTDAFVRKFRTDGTELWTRQFGTSASDLARGAASAGDGDVYVAGTSGGNLSGEDSAGGYDAYLLRIGAPPPVADAGPDQVIECTELGGMLVTLDGSASASSDPRRPLTLTWTGPFGIRFGTVVQVKLPVGVYTIKLTASDGRPITGQDTVVITVRDTQPPVLIGVQSEAVIEQLTFEGTPFSLPIPSAVDASDPAPKVIWDAPAILPPGKTLVTWTAIDQSGNSSTATTLVNVKDTIPPRLRTGYIWDVAIDMATATQNPNGAWTYGSRVGWTGELTAYGPPVKLVSSGGDPGTLMFQKAAGPSAAPNAGVNLASRKAFLMPGAEHSVCRWTAPRTGTYDLSAVFSFLSDRTFASVAIFQDDTQIFQGSVTATAGASHSRTLEVAAGHTLDFVVGNIPSPFTDVESNGVTLDAKVVSHTIEEVALTLEQTGPEGALPPQLYAIDQADPAPTVTPSVAVVPPGESVISYILSDRSGNVTIVPVKVLVADTQPPLLIAPPPIKIEQQTLAGTFVKVPPPFVRDLADPSPKLEITGMPLNGVFPLGMTRIDYRATDQAGHTATTLTSVMVVDTTPPLLMTGNVFELAYDLSMATHNPNGAWTYGSRLNWTGALAAYARDPIGLLPSGDGLGTRVFQKAFGPVAPPLVGVNLDSRKAFLMPGAERSVCRWTAPRTGTYDLSAAFSALSDRTFASVAIFLDDAEVFHGSVTATAGASRTLTLDVAAGQSIDFVVANTPSPFTDVETNGVTLDARIETSPIRMEANVHGGATPPVLSASDTCDASPLLTSDGPSILPVGVSVVHYEANDRSGNRAGSTVKYLVVDTTPPLLSNVSSPIVVTTTNPNGMSVPLPLPTVTDVCDAAPSLSIVAPNVFPLGTTTVTFLAEDRSSNKSSATTTVTVLLLPGIRWPKPADIVYGTLLSDTQLNASADLPGTFAYSPPPGTLLSAGAAQPLTVTFTPSDLKRHASSSATVTINVLAAPLIVSANDLSKVYGAPLPAFSAAFSGLVASETPSVLLGSLAFSTIAGPSSSVGTYSITPSGLSSPNYSITYRNGSLTVTRAPLNIKADDKSKTLGTVNPPFTATYAGFVNGDTPDSLDSPAAFTTTAIISSPVGSYPIIPGGAADANYAITFAQGTLKIQYASGGLVNGEPGRQALSPINANGSSVFNQGSAVPVKFRVGDASGNSIDTPGLVTDFRLVQVITGTSATDVNELPQGDSGFHFDKPKKQWVYNLNTTNLAAGKTYVYRIFLNDGTFIGFRFKLQ